MNSDSGLTQDQRIAESVEQALQADPNTLKHPITVEAVGSTVTLSGHVASQAAKDSAIRIAKQTDGVIDVIDELVIGDEDGFLNWFMPWRDRDKDIKHESGEF